MEFIFFAKMHLRMGNYSNETTAGEKQKTQANYIEWNFVFEIQPMKIMVDN